MIYTSIRLSSVIILRTGADGGHIYIKGRGEIPGKGLCDVFAYFASKQQECEFEKRFNGQPVVIEGSQMEFTPAVGGTVQQIQSWHLA